MRFFCIALIALLATGVAVADQNPNCRIFVSGSTDSLVDQIDVPSGVPFNIYLGVDCLETGIRGVAMKMLHNIPGFPAGVPTYYLTGTNVIGGFNDPNGWAMAWANCESPDPVTGILWVCEVPYFASGAGEVWMEPHPTDTNKTIDCNNVADFWCIVQNLGVGQAPRPGDDPCVCPTPVEYESWGNIKALYR